MRLLNNKADRLHEQMITAELEKINIVPGTCRWNQRCHVNSVHDAITSGDDKIAMCFYFDTDGSPIIHFLNYHGGVFIDNTLGQWSTQYKYYFIKFIGKEDFFEVGAIFDAYRHQLRRSLPWWVRLFSNTTC